MLEQTNLLISFHLLLSKQGKKKSQKLSPPLDLYAGDVSIMWKSIPADLCLLCSFMLHSPQSTHILSQGDPDPETGKESQGNSLKIVLAFFHPPFPLSLHLSLSLLAPSNCEAARSETAMKAWLPYKQRRVPHMLTPHTSTGVHAAAHKFTHRYSNSSTSSMQEIINSSEWN